MMINQSLHEIQKNHKRMDMDRLKFVHLNVFLCIIKLFDEKIK